MTKYTTENTVEQGRVADIWLDGVLQKSVVEADTDEGYVIRHSLDADGKPFLDDAREYVVTEHLTGYVEAQIRSIE